MENSAQPVVNVQPAINVQPAAITPQPQAVVNRSKLFWPLIFLFIMLAGLGGYEYKEITGMISQSSSQTKQPPPLPQINFSSGSNNESSKDNMATRIGNGAGQAPAQLPPQAPPSLYSIQVKFITTFDSLEYIKASLFKADIHSGVLTTVADKITQKPKSGIDYAHLFNKLDMNSTYVVQVTACSKTQCPFTVVPSLCSGWINAGIQAGCNTSAPGYSEFFVQDKDISETDSTSNESATENMPSSIEQPVSTSSGSIAVTPLPPTSPQPLPGKSL